MATYEEEIAQLRHRLDALERTARAWSDTHPEWSPPPSTGEELQGDQTTTLPAEPSSAWFIPDVGGLQKLRLQDAKRILLRDGLRALASLAHARQERLLFVGFADTQTAFHAGIIRGRSLASDQLIMPLAVLCAACGNPHRVKLLQILYLRDECSKAELSQASGTVGGNLYQHLGELHRAELLVQPRRGQYRLSARGRFLVELLFWCGSQMVSSPLEEADQARWFDQDLASEEMDAP